MNKKQLYESIMYNVQKSLNEMAKVSVNDEIIKEIKEIIIDMYERRGLNPFTNEIKNTLKDLYTNWEVREINKNLNLNNIFKKALVDLCNTGNCTLTDEELECIHRHVKANLQFHTWCGDPDNDSAIQESCDDIADAISEYTESLGLVDMFNRIPDTTPHKEEIQDILDECGWEDLCLLEMIDAGEIRYLDDYTETMVFELGCID